MKQEPDDGRISTLETLEIERKYLVQPAFFLDRLDSFPHFKIFQGYAVVGSDGREVRLRAKGDTFYLTVKGAGYLSRFETEIEITQDQFDALWPATAGRQVDKVRYEMPYQGLTIDLDVYEGKLAGLMTAEVEFPSEEASKEFVPPQWFGDEVTHDDRYKNMHLAMYGAPRRGDDTVTSSDDEQTLPQAAAVPYRIKNGKIEICVITSTKGDRWVLPKGIIDHGRNAAETAVQEAHEEAGIRGQLVGEPLGEYRYSKWGKSIEVTVLLLEVTGCDDDWAEAALRVRRWVSPRKARKLIHKKKQRKMVKVAEKRLLTLYPSLIEPDSSD